MNYEIVTDSSCNLPEEIIDELGLHVASLSFIVDGEEYRSYTKGERTDLKQFFDMMRHGKVVTTSQANGAEAERVSREVLDKGKNLLYLGFSSGLSATFDTVDSTLTRLKEEYPDRTIISIDTLCAALGQGLIVYKAAAMAKEGASIEEVAKWVIDNRLNVAHWFTVDDLMFLYRGGRVSKTAAFAGSLLKIKPILHVDNEGHLIPMEKAKGRKKSIHALFDHFKKTSDTPFEDQIVCISHGDCEDEAFVLKNMLEEELGCKKFIINVLDPVIGAHTGPGLIALFFMGDHR